MHQRRSIKLKVPLQKKKNIAQIYVRCRYKKQSEDKQNMSKSEMAKKKDAKSNNVVQNTLAILLSWSNFRDTFKPSRNDRLNQHLLRNSYIVGTTPCIPFDCYQIILKELQ